MGNKAAATTERILKVAIAEFSAKGFDGVRVDEIAARAKINKERIYAYYTNKEKLYAAAMRRTYGLMVEEEKVLLALTDDDIPHLADRILSVYVDFHGAHPEFARMLSWENISGGKHAKEFGKLRAETFGHLRALYASGQKQGVFSKEVSFESFLFLLMATAFFYFSNRATLSRTLSLNLAAPDVSRRIVKECLVMINGGFRDV